MKWSRDESGALSWDFSLADIPTLLRSAEKPRVVYHYTDLRGAYGILTSKTLWLGKITSLNDTSEHVGLLDVLNGALLEFANNAADGELRSFVLKTSQHLGDLWTSSVFVFSLSAESDSLGQWRAYGDDGNGVALGFRTEHLIPLLRKNGTKCDFVNCIYDVSAQQRITEEIIQLLCECQRIVLAETTPEQREAADVQLTASFTTFLLRVAPIIKNPYFREERESRIITPPITWSASDYKVDLRDNGLFERFELSFSGEERTLLDEIVVGPHREGKATEYALWALLQKLGCAETNVRCSDIPFRGR